MSDKCELCGGRIVVCPDGCGQKGCHCLPMIPGDRFDRIQTSLALLKRVESGDAVVIERMNEARLFENIDMAETYPGSGVLNFGEIGLVALISFEALMRGDNDYNVTNCDVESVIQTVRKWWQSKRGGE